MPAARRVWDACVILDYLAGKPRAAPHCESIVQAGRTGDVEIVVSTFVQVEVAKFDPLLPDVAVEDQIQRFFRQRFVISASIDSHVASIGRQIVREFDGSDSGFRKVTPTDAVQVATALRWGVPLFESYDRDLITYINAFIHRLPGTLILQEPDSTGLAPAASQPRLTIGGQGLS